MDEVSQDLVANAVKGDPEAFRTIVRLYSSMIYNVSLRYLHNRQDAEEVCQDVFLTVHRKLGEFQMRSQLKTWLYRITVNTALNFQRQRGCFRGQKVELDEEKTASVAAHTQAENQEHAAWQADRLLALLSEEQRICVILRNIEGLSYARIAEILDIDLNAVKSRLKRARLRLMEAGKELVSDGL